MQQPCANGACAVFNAVPPPQPAPRYYYAPPPVIRPLAVPALATQEPRPVIKAATPKAKPMPGATPQAAAPSDPAPIGQAPTAPRAAPAIPEAIESSAPAMQAQAADSGFAGAAEGAYRRLSTPQGDVWLSQGKASTYIDANGAVFRRLDGASAFYQPPELRAVRLPDLRSTTLAAGTPIANYGLQLDHMPPPPGGESIVGNSPVIEGIMTGTGQAAANPALPAPGGNSPVSLTTIGIVAAIAAVAFFGGRAIDNRRQPPRPPGAQPGQ